MRGRAFISDPLDDSNGATRKSSRYCDCLAILVALKQDRSASRRDCSSPVACEPNAAIRAPRIGAAVRILHMVTDAYAVMRPVGPKNRYSGGRPSIMVCMCSATLSYICFKIEHERSCTQRLCKVFERGTFLHLRSRPMALQRLLPLLLGWYTYLIIRERMYIMSSV